jgi:hypothetical protein
MNVGFVYAMAAAVTWGMTYKEPGNVSDDLGCRLDLSDTAALGRETSSTPIAKASHFST